MFETAFTLWGMATTWLELAAFVLSLACVLCNVYEIDWGWPLAILSGLLYFWLFRANRLYGDAWLQIFFALVALWGWWQWRFGARDAAPLRVAVLPAQRLWQIAAAWLLSWLLLGWFLARATDTDVPWLDAFPTAGSVVGQVLLARKYIENWLIWVLVNVVSVVLFSVKGLWLTALLYGLFTGLALLGYRRWRKVMAA